MTPGKNNREPLSWRDGLLLFTATVPLLTAVVTTIGTIYQSTVPHEIRVTMEPPGPPVAQVKEFEEYKKATEDRLKSLQEDLARAKRELNEYANQSSSSIKPARNGDEGTGNENFWLVTAFKTAIVCIVLLVSSALTCLTLLGDLIILPFGDFFDLTRELWMFSWDRVTIDWYWEQSRWYGVVAGVYLLSPISALATLFTLGIAAR